MQYPPLAFNYPFTCVDISATISQLRHISDHKAQLERSRAVSEAVTAIRVSARAAGAPCELCSLLELSSLDPGLGARAQGEWRAASIARGSRRTRSEKRSGWDSASVGHLVCLVQACVKGLYLYLYLYLCDPVSSSNVKGRGVSPATPCCVPTKPHAVLCAVS